MRVVTCPTLRVLTTCSLITQGGVMPGLVRMLEEGQPPMQRAASNLLATLVNLQSGRQALCEVSRGIGCE